MLVLGPYSIVSPSVQAAPVPERHRVRLNLFAADGTPVHGRWVSWPLPMPEVVIYQSHVFVYLGTQDAVRIYRCQPVTWDMATRGLTADLDA